MQPYTDALERALGGIVARATGELATIKAQAEAVVAIAAARVAEAEAKMIGLDARIADRLAAVKDGEPGMDGAVGERGERGDPGEAVTGPPGERGESGDRGPAGETIVGPKGDPGEPGQSIVGPKGEKGDAGERGDPGEAIVGPKGDSGEQGPAGDSIVGPKGEAGDQGAPGRDGVDGRDGERGIDGAPGSLPIAKPWSDAVHYASAAVTHHGALWQAVRDTGREPPHEDWQLLAAAGVAGRSFSIRGLWAATADYDALDVVMLNGASFVALKNNPGTCPGDGWQLLAQQGKRGERGERGPIGPRGERGADGLPLVAATVDNEGMLTLTNGDGSTVNCDLYPLLTRIAASPR